MARTRLLLHLVDIMPPDGSDFVEHVRAITGELARFSPELASREQWLVFNKIDLLPKKEREALLKKALRRLKWKGRWFAISAVSHEGCDALCAAAMEWVEAQAAAAAEAEQASLPPEPEPEPDAP
jgi:GTPase